jgi:polyferredoxin
MSLVQISVRGKSKPWYRSTRAIRHGIMLLFFVFLLHVAYEHQVKGGGPNGTPSVEAYCPFGGIESLYQFATTGGFIRRIEPSAMLLMGALALLTLLFSRGFCGWICPFGSLQEWIGLLGRKIFGKSYNPDRPWLRALRHLKYVVLVVIVALTWHLGALVFRPYDPFLAFFHLGQGIDEMPVAYALLGVVLLGSLRYDRFFCRFACPLGAVIGILGKIGLTKVSRDGADCRECNLCRKTCFAHIDVVSATTIRDAECNHCLECVAVCPKPNVLSLTGLRWGFSTPMYASALVAGLIAFVGISQASGHWRTKPDQVSVVNAAGRLDPEQIRGWMSLAEISSGYGVALSELYSRGNLPSTVAPSTRLNQISRTYKIDFDPDGMRGVVLALLDPSQASKNAGAPKKSGDASKHSGSEQEIRGSMTLNEVAMKTGVPMDWLLKRLKLPASTDGRKPLRDWMHDQGKSIQDIRDAVAEYRAGKR